jgi:hypothetical protein
MGRWWRLVAERERTGQEPGGHFGRRTRQRSRRKAPRITFGFETGSNAALEPASQLLTNTPAPTPPAETRMNAGSTLLTVNSSTEG